MSSVLTASNRILPLTVHMTKTESFIFLFIFHLKIKTALHVRTSVWVANDVIFLFILVACWNQSMWVWEWFASDHHST